MLTKIRFLSGNMLKIIAAVTMLIDHIGVILFPQIKVFRIIGRLSFPIFAFMIAEGARYTKNKCKYILTIGVLGVICQIPMIVLFEDFHWNILVTFTLSLALIFLLEQAKRSFFDKGCRAWLKVLWVVSFFAAVSGLYLLGKLTPFHYSYGILGCMVAVFASVPDLSKTDAPEWLKTVDCIPVRILCMNIPLLIYCCVSTSYQSFSLLAALPLLLYSGKRGKARMKYAFYVFYPAHFVLLYAIRFFLS